MWIDALPIDEINTFEHRSVNNGVSHKCGHDGHIAIYAD
jgi:metal-dependent amidase/aminoacylase/carboxypeptidase family protein